MRAVIVDLDQTLLRTDRTLSKYTCDVMQRCHDKGIAVMAATARPERSILACHEAVRFDAMTTMNGARILLPDGVLENGISHESGRLMLSRLAAVPDVVLSVETGGGLYASAAIPEWNAAYYGGFPDLPAGGALYKILVSGATDLLRGQMERILTEDVYHTVANGRLVQIMSKGATKWKGIQAMLEALQIPREEAVYFGDDEDDVEPIRMCGTGVAVSNAIDAVKQAADCLTGSNDEDGVARYLAANL